MQHSMQTGITRNVELDIMDFAFILGAIKCRLDKLDPIIDRDDVQGLTELHDKLDEIGGFAEFRTA